MLVSGARVTTHALSPWHYTDATVPPMSRHSGRWASLTALGAVGAGAAALGLVAREVPVTNHAVLTVAAFSPYLGLCAFVSAALLILNRAWWAAVIACILAATVVWVESPLLTESGPPPPGSIPLRVLTSNLFTGEADPSSVADLAESRADVLVAEELTPELSAEIDARISGHFRYRALDARPNASGTGIWSRYPITGWSPVPGYELHSLAARIAVPGSRGDTVVLAAHIVGPWPQPIDGWRKELETMPATLAQLSAQAGAGAVIVAGDFNATFDMRPFRILLRNGYRDAVEQSGTGLAPSFPANNTIPPIIGIDHILTYQSAATGAQTVRIVGSDHLGLAATVHLPAQR